MKIVQVECDLVDVPLERPIETAIHSIRSMGCVLVTLRTDNGVSGEGYVFTINAARLKALHEMILGLSDFIDGRDPHFVEAIWQDIFVATNPIGHKGTAIAALSAIDTACWDLIGRAANMPLHRLFGACRQRVPTYASGGLWLSQSAEECAREAIEFVGQGFKAVKLRLGSKKIADDVERVRTVRDAIGPEVALYVDANQALTPKHAIRLGRAIDEYQIEWFEEPVPYHNLAGQREVRDALPIPVAAGETEYTRYGMKSIIDAQSVDVLMPDLQRLGGLSEFRKAGAFAATHDIPISSHMFTEHSLCLAGSMPNCISVEHMPWAQPFLAESMELVDGQLVIPERPGTGFTFDRSMVEKYRMA